MDCLPYKRPMLTRFRTDVHRVSSSAKTRSSDTSPWIRPVHLIRLIFPTPNNPSRTTDTTLISGKGEVAGSNLRDGYHRPGHEIVCTEIGVFGHKLTFRY